MSERNGEFEYLLHLLNCVLSDTQPRELPEGASFERLFGLARAHSVANMAFYAVERLAVQPEEPLLSKWRELRDKAITKDIIQLTELESISEELSKAGVRFLVLKGSVLKQLYPQSDMRTMSDIDLLIDGQNAEKAREIMLALGYSCKHFGYDIHDIYYKPPVMNVEIHRELFGEDGREFRGVFAAPFDMCSSTSPTTPTSPTSPTSPTDCARHFFTDEAFFAYLLAHAAKHFNEGGTGIRTFLDFWVFQRAKKLDLERVFSLLEPSGLSGQSRDFTVLSEIWFGDAESSEKYDRMTEYILSAGTYGTVQNTVENRIRRTGKAGYIFRLIFPTFEHMKEHYPVLRKLPVLLPFCWLARLAVKPIVNFRQNSAKLKSLLKRG